MLSMVDEFRGSILILDGIHVSKLSKRMGILGHGSYGRDQQDRHKQPCPSLRVGACEL
uniref:Uncharacterized protein n=1 Tax=Helianthus annuus TaxID=4232 RepID=A0A251RYJ0_HELAN